MLFSLFLLGFWHILQPGHGQIFLFVPLALNNTSINKIQKLSLIMIFLHVLMIGIIAYLGNVLFLDFHDTIHNFEYLFSFLLIFLGLYITFQYFGVNKIKCFHSEKNNKWVGYSILFASVIPCPSHIMLIMNNLLNHSANFWWESLVFYSLGLITSFMLFTIIVWNYGNKFLFKKLDLQRYTTLMVGLSILLTGFYLLFESLNGTHT
jgi:ABC-type nickel/cobalt efflux system permease component RcnA